MTFGRWQGSRRHCFRNSLAARLGSFTDLSELPLSRKVLDAVVPPLSLEAMTSPYAPLCQDWVISECVSDLLASKPSNLDFSHIHIIHFFFPLYMWWLCFSDESQTNTIAFPFFPTWWKINMAVSANSFQWEDTFHCPYSGLLSVAGGSAVSSKNSSDTQPDKVVHVSHMYSKAKCLPELGGYYYVWVIMASEPLFAPISWRSPCKLGIHFRDLFVIIINPNTMYTCITDSLLALESEWIHMFTTDILTIRNRLELGEGYVFSEV